MPTYSKVETFGNLSPLLSTTFSVLSAFRLILFNLRLLSTREREGERERERERDHDLCVYWFFLIDLFENREFVLSGKCSIWVCQTDLWSSLMKMINNRHPNTDSCWTQ